MLTADSRGTRIAFEDTGPRNRPAVLFSHSLGSNRGMWAPQIAALEPRFRVVRYDARGHGESAVPSGDYSLPDIGADALAVLDACAIERAHVCGISMGGQVAMWLARHAPDRVASIVLANTGARIGTEETWQQRIELVRAEGLAAIAGTIPGRWFTLSFAERHPEVIQKFQREMVATAPEGYLGCCAALRHADLRPDLAHISVPALVVAGELDPATTVADAQLLCDGIADARLIRFPAAHLSNVEAADEFSQALLEFLGR